MDLASVKQKMIRTVRNIFIGIVAIGLVILCFFTFGNYSEGDRAGTIIKLSKRGYVIKTYEGELNLGMVYVEGSETSVNRSLWSFSVVGDQALKDKMEDAMLNGRRVKLHYKEKYYKLPWAGETNYIVTAMEVEAK